MEAFADTGVVCLLTKKMQLCKKESQRASTRSAIARKKARSARKKAKASNKAATAGTVLEAPSPLAVKATSRSWKEKVGREMSHTNIGEEWLHSSSMRPLDEKNAGVLPLDPSAGADGAQKSSPAMRGCDAPSTRTFPVDSKANSTTPVPLGLLERGKRQDVDGRAREAGVFEDTTGGCFERQKTAAIVRDTKASGDDAKARFIFPDAREVVDGKVPAEAKASSAHQVVCKDRTPSSCIIGVGDGLIGTRARSDGDEDVQCKEPNTSDEGAAAAALSPSKEDLPKLFSAQSHHRAVGSRNTPPATTAESTGAKTAGADTTAPSSSVGFESDQSFARRAEASTAAIPSATGVLVGSHTSVEDDELGSLLSTFERQVERGAELVRRFEEAAAKPSLLALDEDVEAGEGDDGKAESGHTDMVLTMTPSSVSSEDKPFAENCNVAPGINGTAAETDQSVPRIGATPREADPRSDREPERTKKTSNPEEALLCLGGVAEQPSTDGGESINRSLSALRERSSSSDTNTTLEEDNEDYEFTFDDEEVAVGRKSVQFADESRWSRHEIRACFEQHELGDLFYTTAELDSMSEEAEAEEEALERSSALVSPGEKRLDGGNAAVGGSSGGLLCFGGDQVPQRRASSSGASGTEEIVSFEKVSFDDEDSDYDF